MRDLLDAHVLGIMDQPEIGTRTQPGWLRGLDNAQFAGNVTHDAWWRWLMGESRDALFAAVPDAVSQTDHGPVGDWPRTLDLFSTWGPKVRAEGFRAAIVLQDGLAGPDEVPWDDCDAVFVGGSDQFKLGPVVSAVAAHARTLGKWTHMGRVNTLTRLRYARTEGYDSCDGTYLHWPDTNLPKLLRFLRIAHWPTLWEAS